MVRVRVRVKVGVKVRISVTVLVLSGLWLGLRKGLGLVLDAELGFEVQG